MRKLLNIFGALALFGLFSGPAAASCSGVFLPGAVCANFGSGSAIPGPFVLGTNVSTALQQMLNGTSGLVGYGGAMGNVTGHASLDLPLTGGSLSGPVTVPSVNGLVFNFDANPFISTPPGTGPNVDNVYLGTVEPTMVTTGGNITAVGFNAGLSVTSGYSLAILGYDAAEYLTTAYEVTAIGDHALQYCTTCSTSTALGQSALNYLTTGFNDTALGWNALYVAQTSYNTAVGKAALTWLSVGGSFDTAVGESAGFYANGTMDTFIGYRSGYGNLPGAVNITGGSCSSSTETLTGSWGTFGVGSVINVQNVTTATGLNYSTVSPGTVALGGWTVTASSTGSVSFTVPNCTSLYSWASGNGGSVFANTYFDQGDTAVGYEALYGLGITLGPPYGFNSAFGFQAGYGITTGYSNILIGAAPDSTSYNQVTTGSQNIAIGFDVALPSATASGQIDIGNFLYCTGATGTQSTISSASCGVGTKTPGAPWEVNGNEIVDGAITATLSQNSPTSLTVSNLNAGSSATAALTLTSNAGSVLFTVSSIAGGPYTAFGTYANGPFYINSGGASGILNFQTNSITALTINTSQTATFASHILAASTTPTISSCGTGSPSVAGSDNFGKITAGAGVLTSCVINFGKSWGTAPACTVSSTTALASVTVIPSTTQLTVGATSLTSAVVTFICGSTSELEPANDNAFMLKMAA